MSELIYRAQDIDRLTYRPTIDVNTAETFRLTQHAQIR